ncbi:hypothetical protein M758_4G054700 [Ceratodon purpureus]|uniref:Secreted protein n=1 Tax=Ceratodon purpureus TaxID=3225 RepID=A0A8T0I944_CERPU|nr:hypothetical protein KC19_4G063900 [Ceratodon purpureus]KAG0618324.1 hypothetical protein M758_4G054700 [Ceratodon purpureus]
MWRRTTTCLMLPGLSTLAWSLPSTSRSNIGSLRSRMISPDHKPSLDNCILLVCSWKATFMYSELEAEINGLKNGNDIGTRIHL